MLVHNTCPCSLCFFFFIDTATTEIYTLSLHDALPICALILATTHSLRAEFLVLKIRETTADSVWHWIIASFALLVRSEEHTSELQSLTNLVCRLLLEKKKKTDTVHHTSKIK